jgi:hypothetical protein
MNFRKNAFVFFVIVSLSSLSIADEITDRAAIKRNVKRLFMTEQFAELDSLAENYRLYQLRTRSGLWQLTIFYWGISDLAQGKSKDDGYWSNLERIADNWIAEYPESPTAYVTKGIILRGYAWKFRGESWAYKVPIDAWKPFKDNLRVAKKHMLDNKIQASVDPHWYVTTASILSALSEDRASFMALINEGLDFSPFYYQLYFSAIDYLSPKWHGDKIQIEEFANQAVTRTKAKEGMGMYARIYWYASQAQYDENLFSESNVVWSKLREGIFDVLEKYPVSWNIQHFALFSCIAQDKGTTRELINRMYGPTLVGIWKVNEIYEYCYKFSRASITPNA